MVHFLPSAVGGNEKVFDQGSFIGAGGPATNAAITFAALGGEAYLVSRIGNHPVTQLIRAELEAYGVRHLDLEASGSDSGSPGLDKSAGEIRPAVSSIFVNLENGDRSVATSRGVREDSAGARDPQELDGFPPSFDVLLVDGHEMEAALTIVNHAAGLGARVVLDGGSWKPGTEELLPRVDWAVVSERFRPLNADITASDDVLRYLVSSGARASAITRGERSILYRLQDESSEQAGSSWGNLEVPSVKAMDTLAAGDIFHGALVYAAGALDLPFVEALGWASRIAATSCEHLGPRAWISRR